MTDRDTPDYVVENDLSANYAVTSLLDAGHHSISRSLTVMNLTDTDVTLQFREGIPFTIRPQVRPKGVDKPGILVRLHYKAGKSVIIEGDNTLNAPTGNQYADISALQTAVMHRRTGRDGSTKFDVDYFIPSTRIRELGGVFYLEQLDILISTMANNRMGPHPFSRLSKHIQQRDQHDLVSETAGFFYRLRFVDNEGTYGTHYVNINGVAYAVRPVQDTNSKSGIYHYVPSVDNPTLTHTTYKTIEEGIVEYDLYKTREEAITHGNVKESQKQWLKERELEIEKERMERNREMAELKAEHELKMTRLKNDHALDEAERQREMFRLQKEKDQLKDELEYRHLHRKDRYEARSASRRDTSDIIKAIPVVLTAVAGVVGVIVGGRMK